MPRKTDHKLGLYYNYYRFFFLYMYYVLPQANLPQNICSATVVCGSKIIFYF